MLSLFQLTAEENQVDRGQVAYVQKLLGDTENDLHQEAISFFVYTMVYLEKICSLLLRSRMMMMIKKYIKNENMVPFDDSMALQIRVIQCGTAHKLSLTLKMTTWGEMGVKKSQYWSWPYATVN